MALTLVLGAGLAACGSDGDGTGGSDMDATGLPDTSGPDAADSGAPPEGDAAPGASECVGVTDGTTCGDQGICVAQVCSPSRCGDGFVDLALGEECEDGNEMSGDGCSLCRWDCKANPDCDDGVVCNGNETCDLATARCMTGTMAANGTMCTMEGGAMGSCNQGQCASAGCGNKTVEAPEQCDDGNDDETDGCTSKCTFTCAMDADCNNGNMCDGVETCDMATHKCKAGKAVVCMANNCAGTCKPEDGTCSYPDADKDGVSCNTDCNDADPAMFPGGYECKDGKDNDCSAATSDGTAPSCECYFDGDKDGYASDTNGAIAAGGTCPAGYTRVRPVDSKTTDCAPKIKEANPGQKLFFPTGYCPAPSGLCFVNAPRSFDYNCDTKETSTALEDKLAAATCAGATNAWLCILRSGWVTSKPACGVKGTYRQCTYVNNVCKGDDKAMVPRSCQ